MMIIKPLCVNSLQCLCCWTVPCLPLVSTSFFAPLSLIMSLTFSSISLSLSPHTTESRLALSPPPSLGSACRRPTPTTSEASGWPWPHLLASRASLDSISHATRCRRQRPLPTRAPPEPPRVWGGVCAFEGGSWSVFHTLSTEKLSGPFSFHSIWSYFVLIIV